MEMATTIKYSNVPAIYVGLLYICTPIYSYLRSNKIFRRRHFGREGNTVSVEGRGPKPKTAP